MKAIVTREYGSPDVLRVEEVEKPAPKDGGVLVKVHASSANAGDWHVLRADPFVVRFFAGLTKPKFEILGSDIAGTVEAVGDGVQRFKPGDEVYGDVSGHGFGGFAEYVSVPETALAKKPECLSFEEAAAVPVAGVTALQALRDHGKIKAGQKVLINGASGGVGTYAVQIAKAFGAEVTAVCSTAKADLVRSLGADHVIDYTKEDFAANGARYDLVYAPNGSRSIFDYRRVLKDGGIYVMSGGAGKQMAQAMFLGPLLSLGATRKMGNMLAKPNADDLTFLKGLIEDGKIRPVVDREYPLEKVPDAIRYLEEGHAKGKVVIAVNGREGNA